MMLNNPVYVIDLDCTLLSVNSFTLWAKLMVRAKFNGINMCQRTRISTIVCLALIAKKIHLIRHRVLRRVLQAEWTYAIQISGSSDIIHNFTDELSKYVREEFSPALCAISMHKIDAILATAAAGEYAYPLGKRLGFSHVVATPTYTSGIMEENSHERKRENVIRCLKENGWEPRQIVVATDDLVDLPLIKLSTVTYWFGDIQDLSKIQLLVPTTTAKPGNCFIFNKQQT
jgi:phosphoserine phosphatase